MAIVGTAYVRLRVIGDKLKGDIADATKRAVQGAAPDLADSGEKAGEHVGDGLTDGVERNARQGLSGVADDIGNAIGNAMGDALGKSLRRRISTSVRESITRIKGDVDASRARAEPAFDRMGKLFGVKSGKGFAGVFKNLLVSGLGLAVTAAPSVLAFLGAAIGAVAATAVTALASIGPAAAGAGLAVISVFSAIKISAGLVGLAMKYPSDALTDFQERANTFKGLIARPIQAGLLSGLNASMRILTPAIQSLKPEFTDLGMAVGDVALQFADALRQGEMLGRIRTILDTNNKFIVTAGAGVSALGQAFIVLLSHLAPVTDFLGILIQDIGQWVLQTTLAGEASGALDAWITRMFDSFRYFVGIMVDFGVGIWNVFNAAHDASGGMLTNLHDMAASFRDWTGDPANQERMTAFFEKMRTITGLLLGVFGQLAGATARGLESTNVDKFATGLNTLVSVGRSVGGIFEEIRANAGDKLQTLFTNFANLVSDLASSGVIGILASALSNLFAIISMVLNIPGVGALLGFVAGLAVLGKTLGLVWLVASKLWGGLRLLGTAIAAIAGVIGWPLTIIGLLVAALVWFFTQTEIGRTIIQAVWDAIVAAFQWAWGIIKSVIDWIVGAFQAAWGWITGIAQGIWNAVSTAFQQIYNTVASVVQATMIVFMAIWNAIWGFVQPILQGIWDFISMVFNAIRTVIETVLNVIYEIWIRIWPILALPVRILYGVLILIWNAIYEGISFVLNLIWLIVTTVWNAIVSAITTALDWIWNIIVTVWTAVWGFLQPIIQSIWNFIVTVWTAITDAIRSALNFIWNIISTVFNAVWGFISGVFNSIAGFISGVWNGIVGAVSGALNRVWSIITSVWNSITGFIQGAMDLIGGIIGGAWDFIAGVGETVLDGIKGAVNIVIDAINWVIGGINWAIDLANHLPGADIPNIPEIPRLARGGVVSPTSGGTVAMIAEAGRPERIEPLDPSGLSARDRAMIRELAGGAGGNVTIYIGTRELTELVDFVVEDREDRLASQIVTGTKAR